MSFRLGALASIFSGFLVDPLPGEVDVKTSVALVMIGLLVLVVWLASSKT